jgi:DNA-binding transcriptional MerR regulator
MAVNKEKDMKLYYSLSEVARMFDIQESTLRFWEKKFPMIRPNKAGGGVRQYRKEDIEQVRLVYHLVKEKGMTLQGAEKKLKENPTTTAQNVEVVEHLKNIREELVKMKKQLDYLT